MKNYITFILFIFGLAFMLRAQNLPQVSKLEKLDIHGYNAQFNPAGDKLLFTSRNFRGLKLLDLSKQNELRTLTETGSGYGALITDSEVIFSDQGSDGFESIDLETKKQVSIRPNQNLHKPAFLMTSASSRFGDSVVDVQESADLNRIILISANGKQKVLTPIGTQDYLNISLSPDKTKLLFRVSGVGSFVSDLEGNILSRLGNVEFPIWINDETILFTKTTDDGYNYLSSDLFVSTLNGGQRTQLNLPKSIVAIYPNVDLSGTRVVFNTPDGEVYLANLVR